MTTLAVCAATARAQTPSPAMGPDSRRVDIPHLPQLTMQATPSYGTAPMFVGFLVSSSDPEVQFVAYRWNFGDGQTSTLPPTMLFHTFVKPGTYVVSLTASTSDGHLASAFAGVIVRDNTAH